MFLVDQQFDRDLYQKAGCEIFHLWCHADAQSVSDFE